LIPKLTGSALYSTRLAVISFWAVAGTFGWVGSHTLTFGPGPAWLQTINVVFALAVLIPVMAVTANLLLSIDWPLARRSTPLRLALAGTAFFALLPLQLLGLSFRASSTVVQFTNWTEAGFVITVLGAGTLWLMALLAHLHGGGEAAFRLVVPGLAVLVGTLWLGGLLAGFTWSSAPRSQDFTNYGDGFFNTTAQLAGFDAVRWMAWVLVAAGLVWFAARTIGARRWQFAPVGEPSGDAPDSDSTPPDRVAIAAVLVIGVAFLTTVLLPALDASDQEPSLLAVSTRDYEAFADGSAAPQAVDRLRQLGLDPRRVAEGREVYVSEGCVYCHTQQVRANVADVGLGSVTTSADVTLAAPTLLGRIRLGPDLAHAGQRPLTGDVAWVANHLGDPRAERGWSSMPSYDYLTQDDINALAEYIVSLQ
jgi:cytochrome c oxidase cbb3-type subunit I/II